MLLHDNKVIAINGGSSIQVLQKDITVPTFRGYNAGEIIRKGTPLIDIINKEFTAPKFAIQVVSSDSSKGTTMGSGTYEAGTTVSIQAVPLSGYTFDHWNDGDTTNPRSIVVSTAATYTAYFTDQGYSVTVTTDGQGTATASPTSGVAGTTITLTAYPAAGKVFKEWQAINPTSLVITSNMFTMPSQNVEVKAIFEDSPTPTHTISITCGANGSTTPAGPTAAVLEGGSLTVTANPDTGYRVLEMKIDGTATAGTSYTFSNVTANHTFEVTFELIPIAQVTINTLVDPAAAATAGCTATVNGSTSTTVNVGTSVTLVATPVTGYSFKQWDDGNTNATRTVTASANKTYTATFEAVIAPTMTCGYWIDTKAPVVEKTYNFESASAFEVALGAGVSYTEETEDPDLDCGGRFVITNYSGTKRTVKMMESGFDVTSTWTITDSGTGIIAIGPAGSTVGTTYTIYLS